MTTAFDSIVGNDAIKVYLYKLIKKDCIPHSFLFSGPEGVGKSLFAEVFAKLIVGSEKEVHPDTHHYRPEGKIGMHTIQTMREFCQAVYLAPFQAKKKVFIIHDAHRMLPSSANTLLKTFEEPALDSVIILTSHEPERLLPTVLSRCQRVRFQPVPTETVTAFLISRKNIDPKDASCIAHKARGSIGKALSSSDSRHPLREMLFDALSKELFRSYCRSLAFIKEICSLVESQLKNEKETLSLQWTDAFQDKPSALQREMIEKDTDGAVSLMRLSIARQLFDALLSWQRDLQLLLACGDPSLLLNPDYKEGLVQTLQRGNILPLDQVEKAVAEAILSLERSTSLNLCLENLFLKLAP